jgi:hypothetical protein
MNPTWHRPPFAILATLLLAGVCSRPAVAAVQADSLLHVGGKVRYKLEAPSARWRQGALAGLDGDTLRLVGKDGVAQSVATPGIRTLQVGNGRRSNAGRGATIGGITGAMFGLGLGIAAAADNCKALCPVVDVGPEEVAAVTLILGAVGTGIGALIGTASHHDHWVDVAGPWSVGPTAP